MGKTVKKILKIALAIGVIVGTFGGVGLALAAGLPGFAVGIAIVQALAVSTLIKAFTPGFGSVTSSRQLAENLSVFSSPLAIRGVVFGRAGIAGQILFRENIKNTGDTPDELLLILGLAGFPCTSLEKFWFNGELIFNGDSTTGPGAITTGKFANDLWVWFRTGEETSAAFPDIASLSTAWNAKTRILRGIPSIAIRLKVTEKVDGKLEPLAQIKGAKLYDPRLDSTVPGGSGAHRFATPSTWAWSENPKLAELMYLRGAEVNGTRIFGAGKATAAIDLENFASEANICEEQINVVGGGTIDRYALNGKLIPNSNHRTNLQRLLSASAGTMDASGGIYRTFAGAWRASSMTLIESDIDGAPHEMRLQIDQSDEVNIISGSFADPNDNWVIKEYPELTDSASITAFGENAKPLDMPFTIDHRMAQRISKIQMKRANAKRAFSADYWLRAVSLQPGDIVTQTYARYGITAETFRVNLWALAAGEDRESNQRLLVPMQLVEELQSWFDWDETTEEQSTTTITALPPINRLPRLITLDDTLVFEGALPPADPKVGWLWLDTDVDIVFRWSGSAWVEFSKIGAGGSSAMNVGRRMNDLSEWFSDANQNVVLPTSIWSVVSLSAPVWPTVFQGVENAVTSRNMFSERMTIDVTKKHRVSIWARQPVGDRNNYLLVAFYDSAGANINVGTSDATGWTSKGTFHYWQIVNADFAAAFTNYTFDFGGDATPTIPTGAVSMSIGGLFLRDGTNETTVEIQDLFVVELADDGVNGQSDFAALVYIRSASAPATPAVDDGEYDFSTSTLTPPAGWSTSPPAGIDPLYVSAGTFSVTAPTAIDSTVIWSAPVQQDTGGATIGDLTDFSSIHISVTPNQDTFFRVNSNGDLETKTGIAAYSTEYAWRGNGASSDYQVKVSILNGDDAPFSGAGFDAWLACSTSREYHWRNTANGGVSSANCTISFRRTSDNLTLGIVQGYMEASDI